MDRRSFITALAGLPFVGWLFEPSLPASGTPLLVDGDVGIVVSDNEVEVSGDWYVPKRYDRLAKGDAVYFDVAGRVFTASPAGNVLAGVCVENAGEEEPTVMVNLVDFGRRWRRYGKHSQRARLATEKGDLPSPPARRLQTRDFGSRLGAVNQLRELRSEANGIPNGNLGHRQGCGKTL